jgi:CHRD domain
MRQALAASLVVATALTLIALAGAGANGNYVTHLTGAEEVPERETLAQGQFIAQLSPDGTELRYRLIASHISNVTAAHIHLGPAGTNGGVVVFLAGPFAPGEGGTNGVLATGTITAANLTGALVGQPLSALVVEMDAGNAYVNVHTNDGVAPTNTGPGDFPGGEIRGQIGTNEAG